MQKKMKQLVISGGQGCAPPTPSPRSVPAYLCHIRMTLSYYTEGSVDVIG